MLELTEEDEDASKRALNLLQYLRNDTALSDATLRVCDVDFAVHKCVIVSYSQFFRAAFSGAFSESKNDTLTLRDTTSRAVHTTVDYMYGISPEKHVQDWSHAFEVIELSHRLQIERLRIVMTRLLLDKFLTPGTMLNTFYHIKLFGNTEELEMVLVYIAKHFRELLDITNCIGIGIGSKGVEKAEGLEKLDLGQLESILRCRDLVAFEHDKFRAIVRWCSVDEKECNIVRKNYAEKLIWEHVELQRYDADHLHHFLSHPLVPRSVLCSMVGNLLPSGGLGAGSGITGCNLMDERDGSGAVEYLFAVHKHHISLNGEERKSALAFNFEHWAVRVLFQHKDGAGLFLNLVFDHAIGDRYVDCTKYSFIIEAKVFADGYSKHKVRRCVATPSSNSRVLRFELLMPAELPGYFKSMDLKEFKRIQLLLGIQYDGVIQVDETPIHKRQHDDFFEFAPVPLFQ